MLNEAFNHDAQKPTPAVGLRLQEKWRGFAHRCGFHRRLLPHMVAELKKQRIPALIFRENGRKLYKSKERLPGLVLEYAES
ncbi:MAG: hypothetical protein ACREOO_29895 [bacterium]